MSSSPFARELGARLRSARLAAGLSLTVLQARSGGRWKPATVSSYERGSRTITVERLAALAAVYGVQPASLIPPPQPGGQVLQ